jgi:hypothetical protein
MSGEGRFVEEDLTDLRDLALVVDERETAERLLRIIGALAALSERHAVDRRGRCAMCRPARRLLPRRRRDCTVYATLADYRIGRPTLGQISQR